MKGKEIRCRYGCHMGRFGGLSTRLLLIMAASRSPGRGEGRPRPRLRRQPHRRLRPSAGPGLRAAARGRCSAATAFAPSSPMPGSRATPRRRAGPGSKWTLDGLKAKPDLAIVALGANDMLRGLPPSRTRADLDAIVAELKRRGIPVLIAGMLAAPNLGAATWPNITRSSPISPGSTAPRSTPSSWPEWRATRRSPCPTRSIPISRGSRRW